MSETITAYGGAQVPINDLEVTLGYTGGFVTTLTVEYQAVTYIQTITRDGSGNTLAISQWIPQSLSEQESWQKEGLPKYTERLYRVLEKYKRDMGINDARFLNDITKIGIA